MSDLEPEYEWETLSDSRPRKRMSPAAIRAMKRAKSRPKSREEFNAAMDLYKPLEQELEDHGKD